MLLPLVGPLIVGPLIVGSQSIKRIKRHIKRIKRIERVEGTTLFAPRGGKIGRRSDGEEERRKGRGEGKRVGLDLSNHCLRLGSLGSDESSTGRGRSRCRRQLGNGRRHGNILVLFSNNLFLVLGVDRGRVFGAAVFGLADDPMEVCTGRIKVRVGVDEGSRL